MTKNAFDTEYKRETKKTCQFARFAQLKKEHSNGQGTDSQPEVKVEEDIWLESTKAQKTKVAMKLTKSRLRK